MRQRIVVQEGQRYIQEFQKGAQNKVWEVASLTPKGMQIQHARLVNISNPTDTKMLSCLELTGENGFSLFRRAIGPV